MTDAIRKMLDELMPNRNGDNSNKISHFSDKRVCKYDLAGLCPHLLFPNTRQQQHLGKCKFECCPAPERLKKEYESAPDKEEYGYEIELEAFLDDIIRDCDDRISKSKHKLEERQGAAAMKVALASTNTPNSNNTLPPNPLTGTPSTAPLIGASPFEPPELTKIKAEMSELAIKIEELGNEGKIDEASILMQRAEVLKKEKELIEARTPLARDQQLIVCDVCGALLSANESEQRLRDHFSGKMHLGFQQIRDKKKDLASQRAALRSSSRGNVERYREGSRRKERDRRDYDFGYNDDRDRKHRSDDRDHRRDRDYRDRSRDRDRDSRRDDDRDRHRDRDSRRDRGERDYRDRDRDRDSRRDRGDKDYDDRGGDRHRDKERRHRHRSDSSSRRERSGSPSLDNRPNGNDNNNYPNNNNSNNSGNVQDYPSNLSHSPLNQNQSPGQYPQQYQQPQQHSQQSPGQYPQQYQQPQQSYPQQENN